MADDADHAQKIHDEDLARRLATRKAVPDIQPKGRCHNPLCDLDVEGQQLFCNNACEREYAWERKQRGML